MITLPARPAMRRPFPRPRRRRRTTSGRRCASVGVAALLVLAASACSSTGTSPAATGSSGSPTTRSADPRPAVRHVPRRFRHLLPGMPPVIGDNVYAAAGAGDLAPQVRHQPHLVYVPDSSPSGDSVTVISQRTHRVVRTLRTGPLSQHVTPSYDLRHLYTDVSESDKFVEINPHTARVTRSIPVPRPYNLYFTPDGKQAVVMVEQHDVVRFADPRTFRKIRDVHAPGCRGPNHADFSANGRFMLISCEFSGALLEVSTLRHRVLGLLHLDPMSMPQDVRISPDGRTFYVADMGTDEVRLISARHLRQVGRIRTPSHPHGLYPSRDGRRLYVSDRGAGKVSVVSFRTRRIVDTWTVPGGGSPDMGGVSANGKVLWLSGRYNSEVYAFNTSTGRLIARIPVPGSPHGLCVWPQPGRYSMGHTGNMR